MQRYDTSPHPMDPYPKPGTQIKGFRYETALVIIRLKDAPRMRSGEDADYLTGRPYEVSWWSKDGVRRQIVVPEGFITDLTSVPRPLRAIAGRVGPWLEAAIVHDYLYVAWQDVPGKKPSREDRKFADDLMWVSMREAKVNWALAFGIYLAVSIFGGKAYKKRTCKRYAKLTDPKIASQFAFKLPRVV